MSGLVRRWLSVVWKMLSYETHLLSYQVLSYLVVYPWQIDRLPLTEFRDLLYCCEKRKPTPQWTINVNTLLRFYDSQINTGLAAKNVDGSIQIRLGGMIRFQIQLQVQYQAVQVL